MGEEFQKIPERKIRDTTNMFKAMGQAVLGATPLTAVFNAFEIFSPILKAFEPVLSALGAVFSIMTAQIVPQLIQALMPLFNVIMSQSDLFAQLGQIIGQLIASGLTLLVNILIALSPIFEAFITILIRILEVIMPPLNAIFEALGPVIVALIDAFMPLLDVILIPLNILLDVLMAILTPLMPLIEWFGDLMEQLEPLFDALGGVLGWLIVVGLIPLIGALYGVGVVVAGLIDLASLGSAGAVDYWNDLMLPILDSLMDIAAEGPQINNSPGAISGGGGGALVPGGGDYVLLSNVPMLQNGGITTGDTFAYLHANEKVQSLDEYNSQQRNMEYLLEEIRDLNKRTIKILEWETR